MHCIDLREHTLDRFNDLLKHLAESLQSANLLDRIEYVSQKTATDWLKIIDSHLDDAGDGLWLEELVCDLGPAVPAWDLYEVHSWKNWPNRNQYFPGSTNLDLGIDNVGVREDGSIVAIQCKARSGDSTLTTSDLGTFAMTASHDVWAERWVVSNSKFSDHIKQMNVIAGSHPLKLVDFIEPVRELALDEKHGVREDKQLSAMQDEVVDAIVNQLPLHAGKGRNDWNPGEARGHIVLPCGTGKTRIAYRVSQIITNKLHNGGGGRGYLWCSCPQSRSYPKQSENFRN